MNEPAYNSDLLAFIVNEASEKEVSKIDGAYTNEVKALYDEGLIEVENDGANFACAPTELGRKTAKADSMVAAPVVEPEPVQAFAGVKSGGVPGVDYEIVDGPDFNAAQPNETVVWDEPAPSPAPVWATPAPSQPHMEAPTVAAPDGGFVMMPLAAPPKRKAPGRPKKDDGLSAWPFATMEIGVPFYIAPTEEHPEPHKTRAPLITTANKKFSEPVLGPDGKPLMQPHTYMKTALGQNGEPLLDPFGKRVKIETTSQVPVLRYNRKFAIYAAKRVKEANGNNPNLPDVGAWVYREI